MKKSNLCLGMLVMILAFGMTVVGCDDGNNGDPTPQTVTYSGTANGATYTLLITENTARYAAQSGDAYALTVGAKKSAGTVDNVSGGDLTLKPSNAATTFTATVSGSSLTAMNGTITWTDNTTEAAPETLTPVVPPVGGKDVLDGTTWTTVSGGEVTYTWTLTFNSPNFYWEGELNGTYTVSGNNVTFTYTGGDEQTTGTISGNTLEWRGMTFTKQGGTPPVVPPVGTGGLSGTWYIYQESVQQGTETVTSSNLTTYAFDNANIEYIVSMTQTSTGANQKQGYKGTYSADNGTLTATYNQLLGETFNYYFSQTVGIPVNFPSFTSTWYTQAEAEAVIQNSELSDQYKNQALQVIGSQFGSLTTASSVSTNYAISGNQMTFTRDGVEGSSVLWKYTSGGAVTVHATHNWGAWTVSRPATETENGSEIRTCTDPAHRQSRRIPATGG